MFYESIRPGRVASDAVVTDLRVLKYCPSGIIFYKINFENDFKELPRRLKNINENNINKFLSCTKLKKK